MRELSKLGIDQPRPMQVATDLRTALQAHAVWNDGADLQLLVDGITSRQLSPKDAVALFDQVGLALVKRKALSEVLGHVATALDVADARALADSGPELFTVLGPQVVDAGAKLADAVQNIGAQPDTHMVAKLGPGAQANYDKFMAANSVLSTIRVVVSLAHHAQRQPLTNMTWIDLDDVTDPVTLAKLHTCDGFAQMCAAGFTLALNAPDVVATKVADLDRTTARVST